MIYPSQSEELIQLLADDQAEKKDLGYAYFHTADKNAYNIKQKTLRKNTRKRANRMLQILDKVGEPSLSNIGLEGAQAVSVLALHDTTETLRKVLAAFMALYEREREDTYYQAIPSMVDFLCIIERKPQRFGTQWLFDENKAPFLPTVDDFRHVNERRKKFEIEPLGWPKSLAIPVSEQPWLSMPLTELTMRDLSDDEYRDFVSK